MRDSKISQNRGCDILIDDEDMRDCFSSHKKLLIQQESSENPSMIPHPRESLSKKNRMLLHKS